MRKLHLPDQPTSVPLPAASGAGVRCPRCDGTDLLRVRRRWLDRLLSWMRPVYRFRCADPHCAWEGVLPQKWLARDWHRQYYRY